MGSLTVDDVRMLKYFWQDKGDLTRWSGWHDRLPVLRQALPHVVDAWERYQSAERTLSVLIEALEEETR